MDCMVGMSQDIPMMGEGDGTMFDPAIVEAIEQWDGPVCYVHKDIRWTGAAWKVVLDITDDVMYVGAEDEAFAIMADLNSWWRNAPLEAKVLLVYGYVEQANRADSLYQAKVQAMEEDFIAFMSNINNERR